MIPKQAKELKDALENDTLNVVLSSETTTQQRLKLERSLNILPYPYKYVKQLPENGTGLVVKVDTNLVIHGLFKTRSYFGLFHTIIFADTSTHRILAREVDGSHITRLAREMSAQEKGIYHVNLQTELLSAFPGGKKKLTVDAHLILSKHWVLTSSYQRYNGLHANLRFDSLAGLNSNTEVFKAGIRFYPAKRIADAPELFYLKASALYLEYETREENVVNTYSMGISFGAGLRLAFGKRLYFEYDIEGNYLFENNLSNYLPSYYTKVPNKYSLRLNIAMGFKFSAWKRGQV